MGGAAAEVPPKLAAGEEFPAPVGDSRFGLKRPSRVGPRDEYSASVRSRALKLCRMIECSGRVVKRSSVIGGPE